MPFNGTGTFTLVSGNPVVTGTNISSTVQNNTMSDFANGFTNCITRDGQSAPTSNLPMGNQRHTGAANASGTGEYLVYGQTLPATTISGLTVTGNATLEGGTLTIDATSIVLSGVPTITGAATWDGALAFNVDPVGHITGGTYTPTLTNGSDVSSSTPSDLQYGRIGSFIIVSGQVSITTTSNIGNLFSLGISLPVPSSFTAVGQLGGSGADASTQTTVRPVEFIADFANDRATMRGRVTVGATPFTYSFLFAYQVI